MNFIQIKAEFASIVMNAMSNLFIDKNKLIYNSF